MKIVEPEVHLISRPEIDYDALEDYLIGVGGESWLHKREQYTQSYREEGSSDWGAPIDAQNLVEAGGRLCYRSWEPGLNKNVTRVREDQGRYLDNILASGHGSVLEHANFSFMLKDVSRVFTHELVRHRAGSAFSQESLRFVRLDELAMWLPDWVQQDEELMVLVRGHVMLGEMLQRKMAEHFGLDAEGVDFAEKKEKTSFMRRLAPEGLATSIMWTANVRTLRNVIEQRTAKGAEEEIRLVFGKIARIMQKEAPMLFGDFEEEDGVFKPLYRKV